jgi:hypothetical protein
LADAITLLDCPASRKTRIKVEGHACLGYPRTCYTDLNGLICKMFKAATKVAFLLKGYFLGEYCLRNHVECENLSHVPIDSKPCKQCHREIHHLL